MLKGGFLIAAVLDFFFNQRAGGHGFFVFGPFMIKICKILISMTDFPAA